jgi:hypothetical protein
MGVDSRCFTVVDCESGRGWRAADARLALRFAAARYAATGHTVEVVETTEEGRQLLVLPPDAPFARAERGS